MIGFLKGRTVKIVINEPYEWVYGNLLGTIIRDDCKEKITVKLSTAIKGTKITSDLLELSPRYQNETFSPLSQQRLVIVSGALIKEDPDEFDYILIGTVVLVD